MKTTRLARGRAAQAALAALTSLLGASACQDPLVDPAVISGPRVIGARVHSEQDPSLAEPSPGEPASIDWLVVSDRPGPFVAAAAWCRAEPSSLGEPRCAEAPSAEASAMGEYGRELSFQFRVPDGLQPGGAWLAWLGVCERGTPAFDPASSAFACPDGAALGAFYRGFAPEQAQNHNPSLADDTIALDGAPWTASEPLDAPARIPGEPCRGSTLPSLLVGGSARISFELSGDDREALPVLPDEYAAHARESLVYTHVASHAGLERAFSAIDHDAEAQSFEVAFDTTLAQPGPAGETLVLHLLVRDERGGVDWTRREACLLPPGSTL